MEGAKGRQDEGEGAKGREGEGAGSREQREDREQGEG